ncbi:MAG: endonuclease MutS2 [Anaerovoracaceae bacterium]|jgi:DNA mismatch repair protein MutS2
MNDKTFRVLEYNRIKELLKDEASSPMTKEIIGELFPFSNMYEIRERLAETTEAVSVIVLKGSLPLGNFYDIGDFVNLAEKSGVLTMKQLLQVLYNLQVGRNAYNFLKDDLPDLPIIRGLGQVISIQKHLEDEIDRSILSEDEVADNASPRLRDLRRAIVRQNESIRSKLSSIIGSVDNRLILQDAIVTMRQGRYVIPVKQEHRAKIPGMIHDQSSTGATLFIEPQSIVNMNNELRELELEEQKEIARILADLSAQVALASKEIINNQKILVKLDLIFAKGKLSVKMKGEEPLINEAGILVLKEARHPLIDEEKVVPITIRLGGDYHTLVITGPNTGGKTVTLKTTGLLSLMAQTGLHIPASSGSVLPIFKRVYADIGDEQSIEQSLSTFSSHMRNIVEIVKEAGEDTLVLLDELGAGTDPTEGAALAIAILDNLYCKGARTLATTHYTELKKYALSTEGVENASMEFDVETLSPTFKLTVGTPGRSNAFEISKKLGLDSQIIDHARSLLDRGDIAFEDVLSSIERDRKAAEADRDEAMGLKFALKRRQEEIEQQYERLEAQKERILAKAREEASQMVHEAKILTDQVEKELKELRRQQDPSIFNRNKEQIRRRIKEGKEKYRDNILDQRNHEPIKPGDIGIGDLVKVVSLNQKGRVISLPDDRNEVQVQIGALKVNVSTDRIAKVGDVGKSKGGGKASFGGLYRTKVQTAGTSINVIGRVLDDAIIEVDKYLDDAFIAGLKEVTIIHGRGSGVLREGLAKMMKGHKHVASQRRGSYNEGGDGVTIVTLK